MKLAKNINLAGNVVNRQKKQKSTKNVRNMSEKKTFFKRRDEALISIYYTAHFARKMVENDTNSRINDKKNGAFKIKKTLGPTTKAVNQ
jgi:hypothetical protein